MIKMETYANREEWLKNRTSHIGGSDASAIMGLNPWMSNLDLWKIKTGRKKQEDISESPIVKFGIDAEPLMRELFKLDYPQFKVDYVENNIWTNDSCPWAHASLDGWLTDPNGHKGVFENKTVNIMNKTQTEHWNNQIPNYYYCQVLHYLMVTGFDFAILKARLRWEAYEDHEVYCQIRHFRINREDVLQDIKLLAEKEKEFAECILHDREPSLILPDI